jgi:hypothetical protein
MPKDTQNEIPLRCGLEQLDVERLLKRASWSRLPRELLEDALMTVASGLLLREEELRFHSQTSLERFLHTSMIRQAIRHLQNEQQNKQRLSSLPETMFQTLEDKLIEREENLLKNESALFCYNTLELLKKTIDFSNFSREFRSEMQTLVRLILQDSEKYIRKRDSGVKEGCYVFNYSNLAEDLNKGCEDRRRVRKGHENHRWDRRKVRQRLEWLREQLLKRFSF